MPSRITLALSSVVYVVSGISCSVLSGLCAAAFWLGGEHMLRWVALLMVFVEMQLAAACFRNALGLATKWWLSSAQDPPIPPARLLRRRRTARALMVA